MPKGKKKIKKVTTKLINPHSAQNLAKIFLNIHEFYINFLIFSTVGG